MTERTTNFGDRLAEAVRTRRNPVMVGLDPRPDMLPAGMLDNSQLDASHVAEAFRVFCCEVIDVVASIVPVVKPQAAFFERLGPFGMMALERIIRHAHEKSLLVVLDGKRNDIGSTAQAYADAYLGAGEASVWGTDALTVSPYLGEDSLRPFIDTCQQRSAGIFVLVKTSNPGGGMFQDLEVNHQTLYEHVANAVEQLAVETIGKSGFGAVGAVVGATYPEQLSSLRARMKHTWFLIPGFGAQGGSAKDVSGGFDGNGLGAVINSSRGIIFAHRRSPYDESYGDNQWQRAVEAATRQMIAELVEQTPASALAT